MAASTTTSGFSAGSGGHKTQSPVPMPPMSIQHQPHQQQHHQMQVIPSSAAAAAAAAVAAAAQLAAAAHNGRLLQAPPPSTSSPQPLPNQQQQQQQQHALAPLPSWAYGHPALLPIDPQTESLTDNWRQFQQAAYNYNLDPHMLAAMYGSGGGPGAPGGALGFGQHPLHHPHHPHHHHHRGDLTARRKNATRETTSILKAWLNEHKKNPYPTKGEKIMLAIITTMTLTQVSTWFANARRRLKKENKMTWVPRNRPDEDDDEDEDAPSTTAASAAAATAAVIDEDEDNGDFDEDEDIAIDVGGGGGALDGDVADEVDENDSRRLELHRGCQSFVNQRKRPIQQLEESVIVKTDDATASDDHPAAKVKPRIWSIVDTLNKVETRPQQAKLQIPQPQLMQHQPPPLPPMPHQFQLHHGHLNQQSVFGFFGQHPKLSPMSAAGLQSLPTPPPQHHQLLLPPPQLYYSLFNAFNNRSASSAAAAAAAAAAFSGNSPERKSSPGFDQPNGN